MGCGVGVVPDGRSLTTGESTKDQVLDKAVAFVLGGPTQALGKQRHREGSDKVKILSPKNRA